MKTTLIVISSFLAIVNIFPYLINVIREKTKPRVVSWFTWSLLTGIATAASFSDHQYASGILSLIACLECLSVGIAGLRYGDKSAGTFDLVCQLAAIIGLVLWAIFNSPAIAVIASLTIDFIASLPTLHHAWHKPNEETAITFFLGAMAAVFTLLAASTHKVTAIAFPIYLIAANLLLSGLIVGRREILK